MKTKQRREVYVVVRPGIDTSGDMVQIAGIFSSQRSAEEMRVHLREKGLKQELKIEKYFVLDTI